MADILHRVGVHGASPEAVYEALTTPTGLAGWWTEDTTGDGGTGGQLRFRFPPVGGFDMDVVETRPAERVTWRVADGPAEWIGTTIDWTLRRDGDYTIVLFEHRGWAEPVEFMHHCSTKWATFLLSLKSLVETGRGAPAPGDVPISDWH
ncbi:SRPBCC domain-containing protein [Cryptosporangium japonicum]|uniref:SRPBCC domain-containing protein n=1 Tax=Cryptosporangium japonicum TaxID=80872 RepID=A0ABN0U7I7_9ACTN